MEKLIEVALFMLFLLPTLLICVAGAAYAVTAFASTVVCYCVNAPLRVTQFAVTPKAARGTQWVSIETLLDDGDVYLAS